MSYLLDTNVISEWVKPRPDARVVEWLSGVNEDEVFLSVITLGEIRLGVERLGAGARRSKLEQWLLQELPARFEGRLLEVDEAIANVWGVLLDRARRAGASLGAVDGFFAATAAVHGLTLVTRNTRDFRQLGISLLDPWSGR